MPMYTNRFMSPRRSITKYIQIAIQFNDDFDYYNNKTINKNINIDIHIQQKTLIVIPNMK